METRIPPPIVAILSGLIAWGLALLVPMASLPMPSMVSEVLFGVICILGAGTVGSGMLAFRKAQTTVDPLHPDRASELVRGGVYEVTRNPMYVGLSLIVLAICCLLANGLSFLMVPLFMWYITQFQIKPEEKALTDLFGEPYTQYLQEVRRWL